MGQDKKNILCVNGGSSSIKFSVYTMNGEECVLKGKIDRIGLDGASLTFTDNSTKEEGKAAVAGSGMQEAANFLVDWLEGRMGATGFSAIGHRVVHGAAHRQPVIIDDELLAELERISGYDPDHLP